MRRVNVTDDAITRARVKTKAFRYGMSGRARGLSRFFFSFFSVSCHGTTSARNRLPPKTSRARGNLTRNCPPTMCVSLPSEFIPLPLSLPPFLLTSTSVYLKWTFLSASDGFSWPSLATLLCNLSGVTHMERNWGRWQTEIHWRTFCTFFFFVRNASTAPRELKDGEI